MRAFGIWPTEDFTLNRSRNCEVLTMKRHLLQRHLSYIRNRTPLVDWYAACDIAVYRGLVLLILIVRCPFWHVLGVVRQPHMAVHCSWHWPGVAPVLLLRMQRRNLAANIRRFTTDGRNVEQSASSRQLSFKFARCLGSTLSVQWKCGQGNLLEVYT